jgi:hypothetical protein
LNSGHFFLAGEEMGDLATLDYTTRVAPFKPACDWMGWMDEQDFELNNFLYIQLE